MYKYKYVLYMYEYNAVEIMHFQFLKLNGVCFYFVLGDVVWLVCVVIPILSVSLVAAPTNPAVMNQATGKNSVVLNKQVQFPCLYLFICV